ncbi:toll/interleukin-1 receptor domain-containing adapter protein [Clinocottus analis]|uniref:toll/interleukin-1 receptor domain-containing adapter protein n=1 Tax=Clinocottus analis TaxID=304258 RepID=UPI0035C0E8FC
MPRWIQKLWNSKESSSTQREQEAKVTKKPSVSSRPPSPSSTLSQSASSSLSLTTPPKPPHSALSSLLRWSRKYDVLVCHSSVHGDIQEAVRLVSFLEASPRGLRCFLMQRDSCPGGAISTELCQAVQDSHLKALLITPDFLQDDWCTYMMHQILAQGPMSNRIIPLVLNLPHSDYPKELRFYFYIHLGKKRDSDYNRVNKTVLTYLKDLAQNEEMDNMDTSSDGLSGEGSSQKDKLVAKDDSTETST